MPPVFRFWLVQTAIGFALAALFVAALLALDVAGLRGLILGSPDGALALFLLWFFNGIVLGGAQCGIAVFVQAEREEPPAPPPARTVPTLARVPVVRR